MSEGLDLGLEGRVAIVTGAGSQGEGIGNGAAAAIMLARAGARVGLIDIAADNVTTTLEEIVTGGGDGFLVEGDVSDDGDAQRAVADIRSHFGSISILINNVGVAGPPGTAFDVDLERWDAGMGVNVKSMVQMTRGVLPDMVEAGRGSIVNIASVAGLQGGHPALLYATSKGAIVQMTRAMAAHHGQDGVRVNCVAPGMVFTPMVAARGMSEEIRASRRRRSLLQTEGSGWDVGAAVLFLSSEMAKWITGVILPVDAGYTSGMNLPTPPRR